MSVYLYPQISVQFIVHDKKIHPCIFSELTTDS